MLKQILVKLKYTPSFLQLLEFAALFEVVVLLDDPTSVKLQLSLTSTFMHFITP